MQLELKLPGMQSTCISLSPADLEKAIRNVAASTDFSLDRSVYEAAGRDPLQPILYAGSLDSPVAFFGRDLGRDEVRHGEPLIGGAGRRVRTALYKRLLGTDPSPADLRLADALQHVLLTNTVPYKPIGNKAYPRDVKERIRPHIEALLTRLWTGDRIITLGREAFHWFEPYAEKDAIRDFWDRADRFEADIPCEILTATGSDEIRKRVILSPLPHPSPLNAAYLSRFPSLLAKRLDSIEGF